MEDVKRGTGRTTRMILAVGEYLAADKERTATIVIHNNNWGWMRSAVDAILSESFSARICITGYSTWQAKGIGKREFHFFDHHCFYNDVMRLRAELERVEAGYTKYDIES
jgi:hypothetical protein